MAMAMPLSFLGAFAPAQSSARLAIVDQAVPSLDPAVDVRIPLRAQGGVPPYRWSVTAGSLPEGISLTPDGVLTGRAVKPQKCTYTITVEDSASPPNRVNKQLQTAVSASLVIDWVRPPQVQGNRIDGAVQLAGALPPWQSGCISVACAWGLCSLCYSRA